MLPKGSSGNTSKVTDCGIRMNTKFVFILEYDDDDKENDDKLC